MFVYSPETIGRVSAAAIGKRIVGDEEMARMVFFASDLTLSQFDCSQLEDVLIIGQIGFMMFRVLVFVKLYNYSVFYLYFSVKKRINCVLFLNYLY